MVPERKLAAATTGACHGFFTATIASARATIRIYGDLVQATRDGDVEALTAVVARLADANTQPAKAKRQIAACDPA
jgi:hypothetical protein